MSPKFLALALTAAMFAGSLAFASESVDEKPVKRYRPAPQAQQQPQGDYQDYDQDYQQGGYDQGYGQQGYYGQQGCCGQVPVQQPCCGGGYPPAYLPINPPVVPVPLPQPVREVCWVVNNGHSWAILSNMRGQLAGGARWQAGRIPFMVGTLQSQGCVFVAR